MSAPIECNAGIDGGCGACELCDPEWWAALDAAEKRGAATERARIIAELRAMAPVAGVDGGRALRAAAKTIEEEEPR